MYIRAGVDRDRIHTELFSQKDYQSRIKSKTPGRDQSLGLVLKVIFLK